MSCINLTAGADTSKNKTKKRSPGLDFFSVLPE